MKKLAILVLGVVIAACKPPVQVSSPPVSDPNLTGGASAREAVQHFMAAAKAQDLQAIASIWGTSSGPARSTMGQQELEMRIVSFLPCLKHDSYNIRSEGPAANAERVFTVELKFRELTRSSIFYATRGPSNRWYVRQFDFDALRDICTRKV